MFSAREIILSETKPALGCTEPAAIGLNGAYLKEFAKCSKITLTINTNLLKNAMYVPIPNTDGKFGVKLAFALGYLCSKKEDSLNLFKNIDKECLQKAISYTKNIKLHIREGNEIYIKSECEKTEVLTKTFHDNIVYVKTPQKLLYFENKRENFSKNYEEWLKSQPFEVLIDLIEKEEDFEYVKDAVEMNMKLSKRGLEKNCALNIAKMYDNNDLHSKIISITTAASDARMAGEDLPAMSLTGSGNHGISTILPVWVYAKEKGFDDFDALKAVALAMLITVYIKLHLGRLSPVCGAALAGGCAVAGAIAYIQSRSSQKVKNAVSYVLQTINGVICDGAKAGCSLKVMLGAKSGFEGALFALNGGEFAKEGILEDDFAKSIKNLEKIVKSMSGVDNTIVEIMKEKI